MREYIVAEDSYAYEMRRFDELKELIHCRDCKHRMHDKTCIKVMKRKPDDGYCDEGEQKQY
jgi:hypothetical protein